MAKVRNDRKACVRIDFESPLAALEWFHTAQGKKLLPEAAALYMQDGLDEIVGNTGVPSSNRFIVRRAGARAQEVVISESREATVEVQ